MYFAVKNLHEHQFLVVVSSQNTCYSIHYIWLLWTFPIGDNLDRHVNATHAGLEKRDRDIHMYHVFAKVLEVMPDDSVPRSPRIPIEQLKPDDILASSQHYKQLKRFFGIHCLRIAVKRIPQLKKYAQLVTKHTKHAYSDVLKNASVTVSCL